MAAISANTIQNSARSFVCSGKVIQHFYTKYNVDTLRESYRNSVQSLKEKEKSV